MLTVAFGISVTGFLKHMENIIYFMKLRIIQITNVKCQIKIK